MTCFLCLQNLPTFDSETEDEQKENEYDCEKVSLIAINNYLSKNYPRSKLGNDDIEQEVLMCQECVAVASKLSCLCSQLEKIKLQINYSLEKFYGKLDKADKEVEDIQLEEKILLIRKYYRKTCKSKLSSFRQPVVEIEELKVIQVKNELVYSDEESDNDDDFEMSDGSEHQQFQDITVGVSDTPMDIDNWEGTSPAAASSILSLHSPKEKGRSRGRDVNGNYSCATCDLQFPTKWERRQHTSVHRSARKMDKQKANFICTKCDNHQMFTDAAGLRRHNMLFHLELLFPNSKSEGITPTQFREYCKHVLHVEGLLSKLPNSSGYECQHCKTLDHDRGRDHNSYLTTYLGLKKHLFRLHKDILHQKIEELQKNTGPEELKQVVLPAVRDNRKCEDCGASFSQADSLSRHLRQSCPFRRNKSVSAARPCECQDCGARYSGTAAFYRHRKSKHPHSTKDPIFI